MTPEDELKARVKSLIAADLKTGPITPEVYPKTKEEAMVRIQQDIKKARKRPDLDRANYWTVNITKRPGEDIPDPVKKDPWDYDLTEENLNREFQNVQETGHIPLRLMSPEGRQRELLKSKVLNMIQDDIVKQAPPEIQEKFKIPLTTEMPTLAQEQRLKGANKTKSGATYDRDNPAMGTMTGLGGDPLPALTRLQERERRGEKLTAGERTALAAFYGARGLADTVTGGVRKSKMSPESVAEYSPQHVEGVITNTVGALLGLSKGIPGAAGKAYKAAVEAKLIPKILESRKISPLMKQVLVRGTYGAGLGPTLAASEIFQPEKIPANLLHGALLGEVFATSSGLFPKRAVLAELLRNVSNRVLGAGAGQYSPEFYKATAEYIKTGKADPEWLNHALDEGLMFFFSHKGTTAKDINEILPKLKAQKERRAKAEATAEGMMAKLSELRKKGQAEVDELSGVQVNPDVIKFGQLVADFEDAKRSGAVPGYLGKKQRQISELYNKIRTDLTGGKATTQAAVDTDKFAQRVPGVVPKPFSITSGRPEVIPSPEKAAEPAAAPAAAPKKTAPAVAPTEPIKDLHTDEHYVYSGGQYTKTEGKDVNIVPGRDTFLHKTGKHWSVVEGKTGTPIGFGASQEEAISMAKSALEGKDFDTTLKNRVSTAGLSPRYIQAEGAGMLNFQTNKTVLENPPPEVELIEQKLLAGKIKGSGTLTDPHRTEGSTMGWGLEHPLTELASSTQRPKGISHPVENAGRGERGIVIERPYGRLIRYASAWYMQLDPGVSAEDLIKKGPVAEGKTPDLFITQAGQEKPAPPKAEPAPAAEPKPEPAPEKPVTPAPEEGPGPDYVPSDALKEYQKQTALRKGFEKQLQEHLAKMRKSDIHTPKQKATRHQLEYLVERSKAHELVAKNAFMARGSGEAKLPKTVEEQVEEHLKGVKGNKYHPLTARKRRVLARELADEIRRQQDSTDKELFKLEMGLPAEMATPEQVAEFKAKQSRGEVSKPTAGVTKAASEADDVELFADKVKASTKLPAKGPGLNIVNMADMLVEAELRGLREDKAMLGYLKDRAKKEAPPPIDGAPPAEAKVAEEKKWSRIPGFKVVNNLRRMGSGGIKAADAYMNYARKRMQWTQRDLYDAVNVAHIVENYTEYAGKERPGYLNIKGRRADYAGRSEATGRRIREIIEGKIKPTDEVEARAVQIIKERFDELGDLSEKLGLKIHNVFGEKKFKKLERFYPHEWLGLQELWDGEISRNFKDAIIEKIAKERDPDLYNDPVTKDKAIDKAQRYWEDLRSDLKTARYGHLEMQRILTDEFVEILRSRWEAKFPDKPFPLRLNDDIGVLYRYLAGANNRISWLQEMGKDEPDGKGGMVPEKVLEWAGEMENHRNRTWMKDRFADILRRSDSGAWRNVSHFIQTYQLSKMTFSAIPNMPQWFTNTVPNISTKAALQAMMDTANYYGLGGSAAKQEARKFFSETGAGRLSAAMQQAMSKDPTKYAKVADFMLGAVGFTGTEFYNRLYASFAGKRYAEHLAAKLQKTGGQGWRSPQYIRELNKLGFKEADIERLIKDGPMTPIDAERLAQASYEMTRLTQFMTDTFFLPASWANPRGRVLTQFKGFSYNQTSLIYNEPIKQAARFMKTAAERAVKGEGDVIGDLAPMMKMLPALMIAGAFYYHIKKKLYPLLGLTFYDKMLAGKSDGLKLFAYIFNAGGFGIGTDIVASVATGKTGMVNLIGGPTASDIFEFLDAFNKTQQEIKVAVDNKNPKWLAHRAETIAQYWARFGGKLSPAAKIVMGWFSNEYQKVNDFNQWSRLIRDVYRRYKETYMLRGPAVAEEVWQGFMNTQGKEYEEAMSSIGQPRKLEKPTKREIQTWWNEIGSEPSERVPMSGKKKKGATMGQFYY